MGGRPRPTASPWPGGGRRRAVRGLRPVSLPGVGEEEPASLAVRGAGPPASAAASTVLSAECVVESGPGPALHVRLRGLQVQPRSVEESDGDGRLPAGRDSTTATGVDVLGRGRRAPARPRDVDLEDRRRGARPWTSTGRPREAQSSRGRIGRSGTGVRGRLVTARLGVERVLLRRPYPLARVRVVVDNATDWGPRSSPRRRRHGPDRRPPGATAPRRRPVATKSMRRSLVAAHVLVAADDGRFLSSLDPPRFAAAAVARVHQFGHVPRAGRRRRDEVLASPIILYDHPVVAPESQGDMFDATEIDEILALRVLTLTDDEKREARGTDPRSAAIIDRCDAMGRTSSRPCTGRSGPSPASRARRRATERLERRGGSRSRRLVRSVERHHRIGGHRRGQGTRVRLHPAGAPTPRTSSSPAGRRRSPVCSTTSTGMSTWPCARRRPWRRPPPVARPLPLLPPRRGRGSLAGDPVAGVSWPASATSSSATTASGWRSPAASTARVAAGVKVADFGIRGVHLAYELLDGYDMLVLIDAVARGDPPGTVSVIEAPPPGRRRGEGEDPRRHGRPRHGPRAVLAMAGDLGATSTGCWSSAARPPRSTTASGCPSRRGGRPPRPSMPCGARHREPARQEAS